MRKVVEDARKPAEYIETHRLFLGRVYARDRFPLTDISMGKRHNHKIWRINKEKTKIERNKRKTGKDRTLIGNPQHGVIRLLAMERRMRPSRSSVFIVLLCCCWYCPLEANGANIGENLIEFSWNLIGAISRIRHGHDDAVDRDDQSDPSLLDDPRFLYATLYRDDEEDQKTSDEEGERSTKSDTVTPRNHGNSPLLRVWDILEIEHRLRHLRKVGRRSVIDGHQAIDESASVVAAAPFTGEKMGGAIQGGCNMADHQDSSTSSACPSSIQRSPRQVDEEDLEPYVPYLGFIFYSFPIFSFTLPFGGQLKLFGYDFI